MNRFYFVFLVLIFGCSNDKAEPARQQTKLSGEAQGTTYLIQYVDSLQGRFSQAIADSILKRIDLSLSAWVPNSVINQYNASDTSVITDEHFITVYFRAQEIASITANQFQPFIGPLVNAWGFGPDGAKPTGEFPLDSLLMLVNREVYTMPADTTDLHAGLRFIKTTDQKLDVNGIAQGYSVDVLAGELERLNIRNYLVEVGGEVRTSGRNLEGNLWRIGVDKPIDPDQPRELDAVVTISDRSMATSGSYRKFYEMHGKRYSHTIDPQNGKPVSHNLLSVTVQAGNCTNADAFATAFMVMGPDKSKEFIANHPELRLQAYFLLSDGKGGYKVDQTPGFTGMSKIQKEEQVE